MIRCYNERYLSIENRKKGPETYYFSTRFRLNNLAMFSSDVQKFEIPIARNTLQDVSNIKLLVDSIMALSTYILLPT